MSTERVHRVGEAREPRRWRSDGPPWRRWTDPPAGRLPWISSLALALVQLVGTTVASQHQQDRVDLNPLARLLLVLGPALLVLRHRYPRATVFAACAVATVYLAAGFPYGPIVFSVAVACFSAITMGHRHAAWGAVGMAWLGHALVTHWLYRWLPPADDTAAGWWQEMGIAAWVLVILALSELARVRNEQLSRERIEREVAERRRADEERLRIARELHDVLAHSISVINVQAGVGLALLDQDPEQARAALTTIKAASKEALGEVRQVLDSLRTPGSAPRSPAPGLDRLPELTEQASAAGLHVEVRAEGRRADLPPGADLAAFRIVQEALTNIVRHSEARTARVALRYGPQELHLLIEDDGPASSDATGGRADSMSGGNGLVGMRERAAAFGGTVEAQPRPEGGFSVRACIPLPHKETL
ncbi:sensor histidine kinase [Streptomyces zagrosensis]|uniref:histidine kinase n=1 Tax=Streptomyces zagrosensis TaxID=1042984 RepID=A0A7W9Q865_9ACTN|nr:sensor histidine kinase [Streptomyces zagrosensis]MBB5935390.1 signal transduction histidine kinase [Streptomyces zagrosensis]